MWTLCALNGRKMDAKTRARARCTQKCEPVALQTHRDVLGPERFSPDLAAREHGRLGRHPGVPRLDEQSCRTPARLAHGHVLRIHTA